MNRVLPELFGQREEEVFEQLREPAAEAGAVGAGRGVRWPRCSRRPASPSPCAGPGPGISSACRPGLPPALPVLLLPELFTRTHGLRTTHQMAQALGEELGY